MRLTSGLRCPGAVEAQACASGLGADGRALQRSPDRGLADVVLPGQLGHGLARSVALGELATLAGVQLGFATELNTLRLGSGNASVAAGTDQGALDLKAWGLLR